MQAPDPLEDPLICPIRGEFTACDPTELGPLVEFLGEDRPVDEQTAFPRGTMLPDGRLDLCKQSIGAGGARIVAEGLGGTTQTRHLLLGANGLGSGGAKEIAGIVRDTSSLETVYLGCNMIPAGPVEELVDAILEESQVTALWLKRNPIGPEGAAAVSRLLRSGHDLKCLDLVHTELGGEGLEDVIQAMTHDNRSVERLYLCGNRIEPEHCESIALMLRANESLKHLYLSVNRIGDRGANTIASALADNTSLRTLCLSSNRIGCAGATSLAEAFPTSQLEDLGLGCESSTFVLGEEPNHIGDRGANALAKALGFTSSLRSLDLRRNRITEDGIRVILRALDDNSTLCDLRCGIPLRKDLREWLRGTLDRNRRAGEWNLGPDPYVKAIQSVYRTFVAEP